MEGIEHLVVLMLENRSFDHMLGLIEHPDRHRFEGVRAGVDEYSNPCPDGGSIPVWSGAGSYYVCPGPGHMHADVMEQMFGPDCRGSGGGEPCMDGFVANYEKKPKASARDVMRCYEEGQAPVLQALAKHFCVCNRWFCSVPGQTWPNRLFAMCGESAGEVDNNYHRVPYSIPSIFSRFPDGKRWCIYHDGPCLPLFIGGGSETLEKKNFRDLERLIDDIDADNLPEFSWVEPDHFGIGSSSQHAEYIDEDFSNWSFLSADNLICEIYGALRKKPDVFKKTVFLITYDEHGGFYDHVPPPEAPWLQPRPGHVFHADEYRFDFRRLGPRVPAVIVNPRIKPGSIDEQTYDHAAIIRTALDLFADGEDTAFGNRVRQSRSFLGGIDLSADYSDRLPEISPRPIADEPNYYRLLFEDKADSLLTSLAGGLAFLLDLAGSGRRRKGRRTVPMEPYEQQEEDERILLRFVGSGRDGEAEARGAQKRRPPTGDIQLAKAAYRLTRSFLGRTPVTNGRD